MTPSKPIKSHYSETEAAAEVGVTIEELRMLIKSHIVDCDEDLKNVPSASFEPPDLALLKILARFRPVPATV